MFSHWDLDRDCVVGAEEFAIVVNSLAQHAGRSVDADTVQRLLALVDCDGNGKIDLNEWLAVSRTPLA
jgi:Ca2+-binding EF-hand superfamily protein